MKKVLTVIGYLSAILILFATLFKLMHWPGASFMIIVGMSFLLMFFIPLFFINRMIENKNIWNILSSAIGFISLEITFAGIMFKIMHWPGASFMLIAGATILAVPAMGLYMAYQLIENGKKFHEFWKVVVVIPIICLFLILYASRPSKNVIRTFYSLENNLIEANKNLETANALQYAQLEFKMTESPDTYKSTYDKAIEVRKYSKELFNYIEEVKRTVIVATEGLHELAVEDHAAINSKDNYDVPSYLLGSAESELGSRLAKNIDYYNTNIENILTESNILNGQYGEEELQSKIESLKIKVLDSERNGITECWQTETFYGTPLLGTLAVLTGLQNKVLNIEFNSLLILKN